MPEEDLYKRVKKLGDYGLLDAKDKAVLDEGKIVTRLELAFYTEKAKARVANPELSLPPTPTPTSAPLPQILLPTPTPLVTMPTPVFNPQVRSEIEQLLKELKEESAYLKTRLSLNDERVKEQEKEWEKLQNIQDEVGAVWKRANKSSGIPHFTSIAKFKVENFHLSGITIVNSTKATQETNLGAWTDLGGKGSFSLGIGAILSDNTTSGPVTLTYFSPDFSVALDGPLGHWDTHITGEAYPGAGTFGSFTRGVNTTALRRFERPFEIKSFTDDKNFKTWNDHISNITSVASAGYGTIQSSNDRVFSGVYGVGTSLPLMNENTKMIIMLGRQGTANTQTQRWEQGLKVSTLFGRVGADVSTLWMNDNFGVNQLPQMDSKNVQASLNIDLNPVVFNLEAGFSSLYSGTNNGNLTNQALEAPAGQASLSFYPFTLYYTAISDGFSNYSSKVNMGGVNFNQYGVHSGPAFTASTLEDVYGFIGEVDSLTSNRYGWRANFGWNGRKQDWMKGWPSFLDGIVINFDFSQQKEFRAISGRGNPVDADLAYGDYNVVEALNMVGFYYPDDEGTWGLNLYGGYAAAPWLPVRQAYTTNINTLRNDGNTSMDSTRYQFRQTSERIPLLLPANAGGFALPPGSQPATFTSGPNIGKNIYANLGHLKTYNYATLTTKFQFDKIFGLGIPVYASCFFTDNAVSGVLTDPALILQGQPPAISNLFDQTVYDATVMVQAIRNVNLIGDFGYEVWKSEYTYPQVNRHWETLGAGLAYDIPWGGSRFEFRYKHVIFRDEVVDKNNYEGDQVFALVSFLF